jgi:hypothetical protein
MEDENDLYESGLEDEGMDTMPVGEADVIAESPLSIASAEPASYREKLRERLLRSIDTSEEEAKKYGETLAKIEEAKKNLLQAPDRRQYLQGLASKLTAPRTEADPRFFERRNLFTFLRDVGEYGQEQKAAEKERQAQLAALEEDKARRGLEEAQKRRDRFQELSLKYLLEDPAKGEKDYEITRLQGLRSQLINQRSSIDPRDPGFLDLNKRIQEIDSRIAYLGGQRGTGAEKPTVGQAAIDKKFGEEYAAWTLGGGVQSAARIAKINDVASQLQSREDMSGPIVGYALENLPTVASFIYPEAQDAKDVVESVVQTDLRAILGGQFAAREGEALIKRAYNPRLKEEQNIRRLQLLSMQMQKVADEKNRAMTYFAEKGTIKGYNFVPYRATDFLTSNQLKRLDAGEPIESILGEKSAPETEPASTGTQSSSSVPDLIERAKRETERRNRERSRSQ